MFEQTFVTAGGRRSQQPYTVVASTLAQAAMVAGCIVVSLLTTHALPSAQLRSMLIAPPPPAPELPKPPEMARHAAAGGVRVLNARAITAPLAIPKQIAQIDDSGSMPDIPAATGSTADGGGNSLLYGGTEPAIVPPPKPPVAAKPVKPVRVGGAVAEANLIHRVEPIYPPLARTARVQGTVEFTALISKEGRIENLRLVSGHPLLVNAARDAILQWRYRPTMLNGEPVEVTTDIVVRFALASQ